MDVQYQIAYLQRKFVSWTSERIEKGPDVL